MATDKASAQNSDAAEKQQTGASVRENADASLAGEEGAHTAGAACAVENSQGNKTPFISEVSGHHRRYLKLLEFTHSTTKRLVLCYLVPFSLLLWRIRLRMAPSWNFGIPR